MAKLAGNALQVIKPTLMQEYEGRVLYIKESRRFNSMGWDVTVVFHIPEDEADELELYRRVNRVIRVIATGEENGEG